ncbi:sigma-70 family RNA polymerase sigma factor [Microbacterium sp. STN6]|uniref:sigma-70 family RNA polymerase sigma factor n=1 Tax=Microbacterium sp. STN6 TaxID=2995588 RepID=UPI0022609F61|nr:sigma-70 family RNA polymerase sigma factor [Microbacterium sp. STN6]MCX7523451.1 sigma-70 family RNA polymerase sigma factor [Microbacterium sp. STN6]
MSNTALINEHYQKTPLMSAVGAPAPRTARSTRSSSGAVGSVDGVRDYLQQIGRYPLLTAEEEIDLARRIEVGLFAQQKLNEQPDVDDELRGELEQLVHEGQVAHRRFVCCNLKLVVSVAKRYSGRGVPMMDIIQEGNLGLDRAVKKFDFTQGFKFSTYAMWWIRQSITRSMADSSRLIRVPVHTMEKINKLARIKRELTVELGRDATAEELAEESGFEVAEVRRLLSVDREPVSLHAPTGDDAASELGDLIEDGDAEAVAEIVSIGVRNDELHKRVAALPQREADIVRFRYGLDGKTPMTFEQVGNALGVSRERVRQIEARALRMLNCPELEGYLQD